MQPNVRLSKTAQLCCHRRGPGIKRWQTARWEQKSKTLILSTVFRMSSQDSATALNSASQVSVQVLSEPTWLPTVLPNLKDHSQEVPDVPQHLTRGKASWQKLDPLFRLFVGLRLIHYQGTPATEVKLGQLASRTHMTSVAPLCDGPAQQMGSASIGEPLRA